MFNKWFKVLFPDLSNETLTSVMFYLFFTALKLHLTLSETIIHYILFLVAAETFFHLSIVFLTSCRKPQLDDDKNKCLQWTFLKTADFTDIFRFHTTTTWLGLGKHNVWLTVPVLVGTNMAGDVPKSHENNLFSVTIETTKGVLTLCQIYLYFVAMNMAGSHPDFSFKNNAHNVSRKEMLNVVLNCGHWLGSLHARSSSSILFTSWYGSQVINTYCGGDMTWFSRNINMKHSLWQCSRISAQPPQTRLVCLYVAWET